MEIDKKDLLRVIKTLNSIEVKGSENLSKLYASIAFLAELTSKEPAAEPTDAEE